MHPVIRSRAPLRLAFGGGGTDVAPYADEQGGVVLNATINLYAWVTIVPNDTQTIRLRSVDLQEDVAFDINHGSSAHGVTGDMMLAKGVIDSLDIPGRNTTGFDLYAHTDCPPESGLGASSTMVVALIGAFNRWLQLGLNRYEIAELAVKIERMDLGLEGGKQDQYAASFGGFNFMEFSREDVLVNPLRLPPEWISELEYSIVLAFTGQRRRSRDIIRDQIANYVQDRRESIAAMDRTKAMAFQMKRMLLKGDFDKFGSLLHEAWQAKKGMSNRISNAHIDQIYEEARAAGALGGKVSGAGGGGFLFFFADMDRRHDVIQALERSSVEGLRVVHVGFTDEGLQTWIR